MKKILTFAFPITGVLLSNGISLASIIVGGFAAGLCLFLSCFTFLINKGKSFWNVAFILSICVFILLAIGALAKMNMEKSLL